MSLRRKPTNVVNKLRDRECVAHSAMPYVWIERTIRMDAEPVVGLTADHISDICLRGRQVLNRGDEPTYKECEIAKDDTRLLTYNDPTGLVAVRTVVVAEDHAARMHVDVQAQPDGSQHVGARSMVFGIGLKATASALYRCDANAFKSSALYHSCDANKFVNIGYATIAPQKSMHLDVRGDIHVPYHLYPHAKLFNDAALMAQRHQMHAMSSLDLVIVTSQDLAGLAGPYPFTLNFKKRATRNDPNDHHIVIHNAGDTPMHVRVIRTGLNKMFQTEFERGHFRGRTLPSAFDELCDLLRPYSDPAGLTRECNISPPLSLYPE